MVFETDIPWDGEHVERFETAVWAALWEQYPLWQCPYSQGKPPPDEREKWRHGFSSPFAEGPLIRIGRPNPAYRRFRFPEKPVPTDKSDTIVVKLDRVQSKSSAEPVLTAIGLLRGVREAAFRIEGGKPEG